MCRDMIFHILKNKKKEYGAKTNSKQIHQNNPQIEPKINYGKGKETGILK